MVVAKPVKNFVIIKEKFIMKQSTIKKRREKAKKQLQQNGVSKYEQKRLKRLQETKDDGEK